MNYFERETNTVNANTNLSARQTKAIALAPFCLMALLLTAALLAGCSGGGQWVDTEEELKTEGMDQVISNYKPSALFDGPVCVQDEVLWKALQDKMGRELRDVNFNAFMVVGHFAIEPDSPDMDSGTSLPEDRGYGVKIKSIRKKGDDGLAVRLKVDTATDYDEAEGPLHYALSIVPKHTGPIVFYINGVEYKYSDGSSFINKNAPSFGDQLLGKDDGK